jgi:hypothetical protein
LFARHAVVSWGVPQAASRAGRVAAELITRAVETTGLTDPRQCFTGVGRVPPPFLGIRVSLLKHAVFVEVWDSDPVSPLLVGDSGLDRHVMAVNKISQRRNWYRPGDDRKMIWAEIAVAPQSQSLPVRVAGGAGFPEPDRPVAPERDLAVLHSVLEGLRRLDVRGHRDGASVHPARGAAP